MDLPFLADALPDDDIPAAVEHRAIAALAHIGADLDRGGARDVELSGLELERVPGAVGELEERFDLGAPANGTRVRRQDLGIVGVAGRDLRGVVEREETQEAASGGR